MKVGGDPDDDARRAALIREEIGPERFLMMDANQVWDVDEAIDAHAARWPSSTRGGWRSRRAPTTSSATPGSPARSRPIRIATGEHCHNRVMFKQLMQAEAIARLPARRLPARRRQRGARGAAAGRALRRARSARTPAASGLSEYVQHLSLIDYVAVGGDARGPRDRVRRRAARALRRPGARSATGATSCPRRRATASRCARSRSTSSRSRTGRPGASPTRATAPAASAPARATSRSGALRAHRGRRRRGGRARSGARRSAAS